MGEGKLSAQREKSKHCIVVPIEQAKASCTFGKYMCEAQSEIMETNLSAQREKSKH